MKRFSKHTLNALLASVLLTMILAAVACQQKQEESSDLTTTEAPVITTTAPVTTTEAPVTTTTAPVTTEKPVVDELPIAENEILNDALKTAANKYGAVGIQAAVITDGKVTAAAQYGWAKLNETKMEADTKVRAASLSKTIVGMVAFRLVDEGKLSLDSDISDYLGFTV